MIRDIHPLDIQAIDRAAHMERFKPVLNLSRGEYEVFLMLGDGHTLGHIVMTLGKTNATVREFIQRMRKKLDRPDAESLRAFAAKFVERMGKPAIRKITPNSTAAHAKFVWVD